MLEIVDLTQELDKKTYRNELNRYQTELRLLGYQVYHQQRPVVMLFEGWDAGGKGGAIKRLTERLDPRGFVVHPIAAPKGEDAERHYLYRFWRRLPVAGQIAIFDRSWYGRLMVERVEGYAGEPAWRRAFDEIRAFERQLVDFGVILFKFWMHISNDEQLRRFEARKATPYKTWKLTDDDWHNREKWNLYEAAVEDMLIKTTTAAAPWTLVAGNDKRFARVQVLQTVAEGLKKALKFDPAAPGAANLPPFAAPAPVPDWAWKEWELLNSTP